MADTYKGMPFFEKAPKGVSFHPVGGQKLFVQRDPRQELLLLLKSAVTGTGFSDIDYNYAIAQNVRGAFVLRGGGTKCVDTESLKVLMLLGDNERPTDLLKENQKLIASGEMTNMAPTTSLGEGDTSVHVFDLIEFLIERGLYKARNDGIYGPFCKQAVYQLQLQIEAPDIDGTYSSRTFNKLRKYALQAA